VKKCTHIQVEETVADEDEITACCGAACSVDEFGAIYCKCCYATVTGGAKIVTHRFTLDDLGPPSDEWRHG